MDSQRLDDPAKCPTVTPSRRRLIGAMAAGAGALFIAGSVAGRAVAQEATPTAEEGAELSLEALVFAPVAELPPSPALVGIVRVTYPPGAVLPLEEGDPSLAVVYVETGTLTVRLEAPAAVFRAGEGGGPGSQEEIAAGTAFELEPGDSFVSPAVVPGEARNDGTETVVVLAAVVEPAAPVAPAATPDS